MISHPRRTIFVHIPKTGGQSIVRVFVDDLAMPEQEARASLCLGYNANPARGPRRLTHLYADEYTRLGYISGEDFAAYTSFAVVRHPYDRAVSAYRFRRRRLKSFASAVKHRGLSRALRELFKPLSFGEFLKLRHGPEHLSTTRHLRPQTRYLTGPGGELLVNQLLKFETLKRDLPPLFEKIFGTARPLPHLNASSRHADFSRDDLTREHKRLLLELYRSDFERFGYAP